MWRFEFATEFLAIYVRFMEIHPNGTLGIADAALLAHGRCYACPW